MTGRELRVARLQLGLTQRELGKRIGSSEVSISKFERGRRKIPKTFVLALRYLLLTSR